MWPTCGGSLCVFLWEYVHDRVVKLVLIVIEIVMKLLISNSNININSNRFLKIPM